MPEEVKFRCRVCGIAKDLPELVEDRIHSNPWPKYSCRSCVGDRRPATRVAVDEKQG